VQIIFNVTALLVLLCDAHILTAQVADEQSTFRLAQLHEQAGKYEQALRYYQDLSAYRPSNYTYFEGVRRCLTQLKRYDDVVALITERLSAFPKDVQLFIQRGSAYYRKGDEIQTYKDWDDAIALQPKTPQTYLAISDEAIDNRLYTKALEYLLRARKELHSPQLFIFEVARAYVLSLDFEQAMQEYVNYLEVQPATVWQIQQQISQFSDIPEALASAKRVIGRAASNRSDDADIRYLLAWIYMEGKEYDAAASVYREIDKLKHAGGLELLQFAKRAFNDKAYKAAKQSYQELTESFPKANFAAEAAFYSARCTEALSEVGELPDELSGLGETNFPSSEAVVSYKGAISLYEDVVTKFPHHPVASESLYRIAVIKLMSFGDPDGAYAVLQEIAQKRLDVFGKADALVLMGDIHLVKGDLEAALAQYESVLTRTQLTSQETDDIRYKIGEALYFSGNLDSATKVLEPLTINSTSDIANDALALGLFIQQYSSPTDAALKQYARLIFLAKQKKYSEAAALAQHICNVFPTAPILDQTLLVQGRMQTASEQFTEAEKSFTDFLSRFPDSIVKDKVLFALGKLYEEGLHDEPKAINSFQQLLNEVPHSVLASQARAKILHLRKGNS